jgi:two-component system LytT family response regulator
MKKSDTIQILVVDDEAAGRGILTKLLPEVFSTPIVLKEACGVAEAITILQTSKIDILFLDVQMPEQNGFDLLRQISKIDFETIFVTGFDKYAIHAFRFNALDYLLKPVDIGELKLAVSKAVKRINEKKSSAENIKHLLLPAEGDVGYDKKIALHIADKVVFIDIISISHILASDNYSELITCEKERFITPRLLKEFEVYFEYLPAFIRISRSIIINAKCIKSYSKDFPCCVEMQTGVSFEISRRKKADVLKVLELMA